MNLCYCDESGTGEEPIAVMAGVVVDAGRMHLTKAHWAELLEELSRLAGRPIVELHTREFYPGNGVWRDVKGPKRTEITDRILAWLAQRKHHVVYASVVKDSYRAARESMRIPDELNTVWRFMGFHVVLAMQKHGKNETGVKGHTIFVFDNEERENMRFTDLIARPPEWSDGYYLRKAKEERLHRIVDVPYFGDSREVALIQLADFVSFFLRRYAEVSSGLSPARYPGEEKKLEDWARAILQRSIDRACIYPQRGRDFAAELFFEHAAPAIRDLK